MARIAILTDSTADLPEEIRARYNVTVVPLNVHFGDEVFLDQVELSTDDFIARLKQTSVLPTTSQPSPGRFEEAFRQLTGDHDAIVAVLISSKLSGTAQTAMLARTAVADQIPVEVVDSLSGSMGAGLQVIRAAELANQGMPAAAIAERLRAETVANHIVFFPETLEFLQRGGRIGRAAALIGGIIKLKPLLRVSEGQVVPFERTRTHAKAVAGLIDFARGMPQVERVSVLYGSSSDDAVVLADRLATALGLPRDEIIVARMGPVIGAHIGPDALGVALFEGANI